MFMIAFYNFAIVFEIFLNTFFSEDFSMAGSVGRTSIHKSLSRLQFLTKYLKLYSIRQINDISYQTFQSWSKLLVFPKQFLTCFVRDCLKK